MKVAQSCLTLCSPTDYRVHGILQARILEWVAFPFSRGSSKPTDWTQVSHIVGRRFTFWARVWRRQWQPTPVLLPGKSHGWRSLVGYSPWGCKESDTTERLHLSQSMGFPCGSAGKESACSVGDLGSIPGFGRSPGEGKGYPLQYSGLENSMDSIVRGAAKSQTWLSNFHLSQSKKGWDKKCVCLCI